MIFEQLPKSPCPTIVPAPSLSWFANVQWGPRRTLVPSLGIVANFSWWYSSAGSILFYTGMCYNNFSYIFIFSQMWQPFSWESKLNTSQVPISPWKMPRSPWKLQKIHGVGRCCIGCPESEKSSLWHWKNHGSNNNWRYIGYHI